jgi:arylsulfatase A-like enzyme
MMDKQFGRVLDKLRELGLEKNTLVIFTSDHGDMQAAHGMVGKALHAYFEELVRVPLIVRYPQSIPPGRVLDMHANSVDIMPTVLDYVGMPIPKTVQGRSLRPFLDGVAEPDDQPGFCERLIDHEHVSRMIRTTKWKYVIYGVGRRELFNLADDPGEKKNLADAPAYSSQQNKLENQMRDWMKRTNDPALKTLFPTIN